MQVIRLYILTIRDTFVIPHPLMQYNHQKRWLETTKPASKDGAGWLNYRVVVSKNVNDSLHSGTLQLVLLEVITQSG